MTVQLSNLEHLPNYQITERLDVVYGSTVRSKHVGKDLFAGLKNIVGGELTAYTELLEESRQEAIDRMIVKAESLGADAVVGLRFSTSSIAQGASELFVYGTAVKAIPMPQQSHQNPTNDFHHHSGQHPSTQIPSSEPTDELPRFNPFG
ncbi:YbjQ family protein [Psychrobacter sp. NZS113]|uniref:YbjQ family protein n=1 Tax=Psychrobacter sp. NZS113 TaxID=2792045 RepID=UPI0018CFCD44|nr:YbjQ family protein [Psychrobacter sp. NZS113]MBH0097108.1 YbjQ family protein [Psychrobacter sp. NZS113]